MHAVQAGVFLIDDPVVRSGMEVTGGAGLDAIAADLHLPEQSLAQRNEDILSLFSSYCSWLGNRKAGSGPCSTITVQPSSGTIKES